MARPCVGGGSCTTVLLCCFWSQHYTLTLQRLDVCLVDGGPHIRVPTSRLLIVMSV